jgi:hypothetical protein
MLHFYILFLVNDHTSYALQLVRGLDQSGMQNHRMFFLAILTDILNILNQLLNKGNLKCPSLFYEYHSPIFFTYQYELTQPFIFLSPQTFNG